MDQDTNGDSRLCPMCGQPSADAHGVCPHCGEAQLVDTSLRRRFRWRIIPAFLLAAYGSLFILSAIANLSLVAISNPLNGTGLAKALLPVIPAIAFIAAARFWWTGRWWWAIGTTILSYPVTLVTVILPR